MAKFCACASNCRSLNSHRILSSTVNFFVDFLQIFMGTRYFCSLNFGTWNPRKLFVSVIKTCIETNSRFIHIAT